MGGMSINKLPIELLGNIISFLSPWERRQSALISRRFAEAFNALPMSDIWLDVPGNLIDKAGAIISNSNRQYKNLRICYANPLEFDSMIWTKLGMSLRQLQIVLCQYGSSKVFYSILHACPNLEILEIRDRFDASMWEQWLKLPSEINLQDIQNATHKLYHLHLGFRVNACTLEKILVAMPNVSKISVSHFEPNSDFLDRLPEILGTSRRIACIYGDPDMNGVELRKLLKIASTYLRSFRMRLPHPCRGVYEELESCTELRRLELHLNENIDDFLLQDILRNKPELEVLKVSQSLPPMLSHEALMPILKLTKLRKLHLDLRLNLEYGTRAVEDSVHDLEKLLSLEYIHLSWGFGIINHSSFQNLARLPKLRELSLEYLNWDADCLKVVLFNLRKLRRLSIQGSTPPDHDPVSQWSESERKVLDSTLRSRSDLRKETIKSLCLETLEMRYLPVTDVGLTCIATHHSQLKVLKLRECVNITDAGLINLLQQEPLLEKLYITNLWSINGSFLEALGELCPRLHLLEIQRCTQIRPIAVKLFKSQRPTVLLRNSLAYYSPHFLRELDTLKAGFFSVLN